MNTKKEKNINVKIEGEAFERIKAKSEAYDNAMKELSRAREEAHKELWNTIYEEFPQFDRDAHLSLDTEYGDLGFYVLKEKDDCASGLLSALKAAIK